MVGREVEQTPGFMAIRTSGEYGGNPFTSVGFKVLGSGT